MDNWEASRDDAWREYEVLAKLFEGYLSTLMSAATGFFLVAGGIVTFVLADDGDAVEFALLIPIAMGVGIALAMLVAWPGAQQLEARLAHLGRQLQIGLTPHTRLLKWGVAGVATLSSLSAVLTTVLLVALRIS